MVTERQVGLVPQSILPTEYTEEAQRAMDEALRELFRVPYPELEVQNPDICTEVALEELASQVGVGYPHSVLYNPILCLDCRRQLVKNAHRITNHGTDEAFEAFSLVSESSYVYELIRDVNGIPFRIEVTVYVTQEQNNEQHQTYYTQAYREISPLLAEQSVTLEVQFGEAGIQKGFAGYTTRDFYYFLEGETDFP